MSVWGCGGGRWMGLGLGCCCSACCVRQCHLCMLSPPLTSTCKGLRTVFVLVQGTAWGSDSLLRQLLCLSGWLVGWLAGWLVGWLVAHWHLETNPLWSDCWHRLYHYKSNNICSKWYCSSSLDEAASAALALAHVELLTLQMCASKALAGHNIPQQHASTTRFLGEAADFSNIIILFSGTGGRKHPGLNFWLLLKFMQDWYSLQSLSAVKCKEMQSAQRASRAWLEQQIEHDQKMIETSGCCWFMLLHCLQMQSCTGCQSCHPS